MANELEVKKSAAVEKVAPTALEVAPDYIEAGREGLEDITKSDLLTPRLALAQALSPQVTEGDPAQIEGLKPGDLFNSQTGENYGREVIIQVLRKDKLRGMEFYSIDEGGGVKDPNVPLDDPRLKWGNSGDKKADKPKATLFRDYIVRLIPSGEMIALSFKASGIRVAKELNNKLILRVNKEGRPVPIYAGLYKISTDTNLKPKPHKVYVVENAGWASLEDLHLGKQMCESIKGLDLVESIDRDTTTTTPADDDIPF